MLKKKPKNQDLHNSNISDFKSPDQITEGTKTFSQHMERILERKDLPLLHILFKDARLAKKSEREWWGVDLYMAGRKRGKKEDQS